MKKRWISFLLCLVMVLGMIPAVSPQPAEAAENLNFDVDFEYPYETPEEAMNHDEEFMNFVRTQTDTFQSPIRWKHAYDWPTFETLMNSTAEEDRYVIVDCDITHDLGKSDYRTITVTTDKVLDLNGHAVTLNDKRNKANGSDNYSQSKTDRHFNTHMFSVMDGATFSIIDSSGEDAGVLYCNAYMINPFENRIRRYTIRDLIWLDGGNLVVYGGTLQAGRQKNQTKETTWGKIKTVIGSAVTLATDIAGYATGINTATGKLEDAEFNFQKAIEEASKKAGDDDRLEQTLSSSTKKDGSDSVKEDKQSSPTSEAKSNGAGGRDQTTAEKQAGKGDADANKANKNGSAKEMDAHSKMAEAQNAVVNAAVNKDKINSMVDSAFKLGEDIAKCFRSDTNSLVTQAILGTVVHVGNGSTFVAYGGQFIGHGMTANNRDAVIECCKNGKVYVYGGTFEGRAGANIFNEVEAYNFPQKVTMYSKNADGSTKETEVTIPLTETNSLRVLNYAGSTAYSTANIQIRGGVFRNYCEYNMLGLNADTVDGNNDHDSDTMTTFPGTKGCVNVGIESYNENLIRDGRIQLVDNYGDGNLVLMDEQLSDSDEIYHYRLFCNDEELRMKSYLTVHPNDDGLTSSYSFGLKTRANNSDTEQLDSWLRSEDGEDDRSSVFGSTEKFFIYDINDTTSDKIYVIPYLTDTDPYGENLDASEVWYYNTPVLASNSSKKLTTFRYGYTDGYGYQGTQLLHADERMDLYDWSLESVLSDLSGVYYKSYLYDYLAKLKWFTYKVYRVDPLTRENIPENGKFGSDSPLVQVSYGTSDDSLKCRLDLDKLGIEYKNGEMYRIVLTVDEYVNYNSFGKELPTASCKSSIVFQCRGYDEFAGSSDNDDRFTPVQWQSLPEAGSTAKLEIVNGKTGQIDFETRSLFNINYQWFVVDKDGKETMIAGTDNIYRESSPVGIKNQAFTTIQKNRAAGTDTFQYVNTKPLNSDATKWTQEELHVRWDMMNSKDQLTKNGDGSTLSLSNNNWFYGNTDSCFIPEEYGGYDLYCKVTAVNCYWPKNYDHIQVFYSHKVPIIAKDAILFNFNGDEGITTHGLCKPTLKVSADAGKVVIPNFEILNSDTKTLLGWSANPNASTPTYKPGATVSGIKGTMTLYAVYQEKSYTITFDANGGSGGPGTITMKASNGEAIPFPTEEPEKTGMIFCGWSTTKHPDNDKGEIVYYRNPNLYWQPRNQTFYAVWASLPSWKVNLTAGQVYTYEKGAVAQTLKVSVEDSLLGNPTYRAYRGSKEQYEGTASTNLGNLLGYVNQTTPITAQQGEWYYWFEADYGGPSVKSNAVIVRILGQVADLPIAMNHSGLLEGTTLSEYSFSSSGASSISVAWKENGTTVAASTVIRADRTYEATLTCTAPTGVSYHSGTKASFRDEAVSGALVSTKSYRVQISSMKPTIPLEVYVEGVALTADNPSLTCSGGGTAVYDPYNSTLTLDRARIYAVPDYIHHYGAMGIYVSQASSYGLGADAMFTIAVESDSRITTGQNSITVNGRTYSDCQGLTSDIPVTITQGSRGAANGAKLGFYGAASLWCSGWADRDDVALYLNAPVEDMASGFDLADAGYMKIGENGTYRGQTIGSWGLLSDVPGMYAYSDYYGDSNGVPLESRVAAVKDALSDYRPGLNKYTYTEIGVDYGVQVMASAQRRPNGIYINSANAGNVLHENSFHPSIHFIPDTMGQEGVMKGTLVLWGAELYADEAGILFQQVENQGHRTEVEVYVDGDNTIQLKDSAVGINADGWKLDISGPGSLQIEDISGGSGVLTEGILCDKLIYDSGVLSIKNTRRGINANTFSYWNGDISIYVPTVSSTYNYAIRQAPAVVSSYQTLYVGNTNSLAAARAFTGKGGDSLMSYHYARLWNSNRTTPVLNLQAQLTPTRNRGETFFTGWPQNMDKISVEGNLYATAKGSFDDVRSLSSGNSYRHVVTLTYPQRISPDMVITINGKTVPVFPERNDAYYAYRGESWAVVDGEELVIIYDFTYTASGGAALSGTVSGVGQAVVQLVSRSGSVSLTRTINPSETYRFEGIPAGEYTLTITREGYLDEIKTFTMGTVNKTMDFSMDRIGDVDRDEKLTLKDVYLYFSWYTGQKQLSYDVEKRADVNGDGSCNLKDMVALYRKIL